MSMIDARETRACLRAQTRVFLAMDDWDRINYRRDRSWIRDWPERNKQYLTVTRER